MIRESDMACALKSAGEDHVDDHAMWNLVYDELRGLAGRFMSDERAEHTLQPTALVNEAYLRLAGDASGAWVSRDQFFFNAGRAMRRILVDHARRRHAIKRGSAFGRQSLDCMDAEVSSQDVDILDLDEALQKLALLDPQLVRIVEMRFFGGMTFEEAAGLLRVAPITAKRLWKMARGWLRQEIGQD